MPVVRGTTDGVSARDSTDYFPAPLIIRIHLRSFAFICGSTAASLFKREPDRSRLGMHQSTNMNSDVLKMTRHRLAIPFFSAKGASLPNSSAVASRFNAS